MTTKCPSGGQGLDPLAHQLRHEGISALLRILGLGLDTTEQHHGLLIDVEMLNDHHILEVGGLGRTKDDGDVLSTREGVEHGNLGEVAAGRVGQLDGQIAPAVVLGMAVGLLHALEAPLVGAALDGCVEGVGIDLVLGPKVGLGHESLGEDCEG